ncbi:MAG: hypothetical protein ACQESE_01000 [Nanobdellota archaeon]
MNFQEYIVDTVKKEFDGSNDITIPVNIALKGTTYPASSSNLAQAAAELSSALEIRSVIKKNGADAYDPKQSNLYAPSVGADSDLFKNTFSPLIIVRAYDLIVPNAVEGSLLKEAGISQEPVVARLNLNLYHNEDAARIIPAENASVNPMESVSAYAYASILFGKDSTKSYYDLVQEASRFDANNTSIDLSVHESAVKGVYSMINDLTKMIGKKF